MTDRRVMMIQLGARRNFVYAHQLEAAGLLRSLVTDAAWARGRVGPVARLAARLSPRFAGALARRTLDGLPGERLRASAVPNLAAILKSVVHEERAYAIMDETLAWSNRRRDLDGADIVVNYHGNGGSFLEYAKSRGASIVTDFIITPRYLEIEDRERSAWPDWETNRTSKAILEFYRRRMIRLVAMSDVYLCPSETVVQGLADLPGFDPARVRILPYGVSGVLLGDTNPILGRVLFAGAAGLRKGLPYLAKAAHILKGIHKDIEIVIAGPVTPLIRARPETQDLTFLGPLDRQAMAKEFSRADLFCLPSLAEGSATAVYEALAHGLPVVTTASAGSIVSEGIEGLIVPERDPGAIADAISAIVADRQRRAAMSKAARVAAAAYSDEACGRQFIDVIQSVAAARSRC